MPKPRLMTPGPTQVPEAARLALARQVTHHRTAEFRAVHAKLIAGLQDIFQTQNDIVTIAGSGTAGMEAAVSSVVPRGGKAIVLESGKFSERWRILCERFGIEVVRYELPWGEPFEAARVGELLEEHPDAAAVYSTLCETSTGVGHDIGAIGEMISKHKSEGKSKALLVVDGISSVGAMECRTDQWEIDILVVGSQKALMGPPGLAFLAISPAAWDQIESIDRQAFYLDLAIYRKNLETNDTPFTPARFLIEAMLENIRLLQEEGVEKVWNRVRRLSEATQAGLEALGLTMVAKRPAEAMTAAYLPEGIDGKAFLSRLEARFGIKLAGGQGDLSGKILRIGHFGEIDELDIVGFVAAVELLLVEYGKFDMLGDGQKAVLSVLAR